MAEAEGLHVALVLGSSTGGIGRHVRSLATELAGLGVAVSVFGPAATGELFAFTGAGAAFAPVEISTGPRPVTDLATVRRLRRLFTSGREPGDERIMVVHAHGLRAGLLSGLATGHRPDRVPLVVTWHNAILASGPRRAVLAGMERQVARHADVTLGASTDLVERARALGATDARLGPVAAPVLARPVREPAALRAALGAGDRPLVLAVGRLAPQKGYPFLLDAARGWRELDPVPLVLVVGDGPLRAELQARIEAERLPVRLLGHRDDVSDLLAACDLVVLPSVWEARSLVAQEALRAGRPLVATAVGGVPELVGDAAVLLDYGDVARLREAVADLLARPDECARLAELSRATAAGWPSEADTAAQLLAVYRELVEARPRR